MIQLQPAEDDSSIGGRGGKSPWGLALLTQFEAHTVPTLKYGGCSCLCLLEEETYH